VTADVIPQRTTSVGALYHQGQLRLLEPVSLVEGQQIHLHIVETKTPLKTLIGDLLASFEGAEETIDEAALGLLSEHPDLYF
jgi:predicted DNA-binding antitoxin AbrB/MazE fold protein